MVLDKNDFKLYHYYYNEKKNFATLNFSKTSPYLDNISYFRLLVTNLTKDIAYLTQNFYQITKS